MSQCRWQHEGVTRLHTSGYKLQPLYVEGVKIFAIESSMNTQMCWTHGAIEVKLRSAHVQIVPFGYFSRSNPINFLSRLKLEKVGEPFRLIAFYYRWWLMISFCVAENSLPHRRFKATQSSQQGCGRMSQVKKDIFDFCSQVIDGKIMKHLFSA